MSVSLDGTSVPMYAIFYGSGESDWFGSWNHGTTPHTPHTRNVLVVMARIHACLGHTHTHTHINTYMVG